MTKDELREYTEIFQTRYFRGIFITIGIKMYPFPEAGQFFGNDEGHLVCVPMKADGTLENEDDLSSVEDCPTHIWTLIQKRIPGNYATPGLYDENEKESNVQDEN